MIFAFAEIVLGDFKRVIACRAYGITPLNGPCLVFLLCLV